MNYPIQPIHTLPIPIVEPIVRHHPDQGDSLDVRQLPVFLLAHRWLILGVALLVAMIGATYAFITAPVYRSNLLIHVEDSAGTSKNILGDLAAAFNLKTDTAAEMEILRSRRVVAGAVDKYDLQTDMVPRHFPLLGGVVARYNKQLSEPGLFGSGGYAWGNERAEVRTFNVPPSLESTEFLVTTGDDGEFRLQQRDEGIDTYGKVGEALVISVRGGEITLLLESLHAKRGVEFLLSRANRAETIAGLQEALKILERGKQSGVIGVTLEGTNPKLTQAVLQEVGDQYIRQNEDRKAEEAEKSLVFLNKQLPELKRELEQSEALYNEARNRYGTVDLGEEARVLLQQSSLAQTRALELRQKRSELLGRFTPDHPTVEAVDQQLRQLGRDMSAIDAKIRRLPVVEQEVVRLARDVKVNTEVYTALLSSSQQLRLVTESKVANVRLLDSPVTPVRPVKPRRMLLILLSGLIGLALGVAAAAVKKAYYRKVSEPEEIEKKLGLTVSAAIPHSTSQKRLFSRMRNNKGATLILPQDSPFDITIESLRSFRSLLQFIMPASRNNIIMLTGPTPGVGKSFVSANLAAVLASIGKRVLLVDADMRTGYLHRYFGLRRENGLAELIAGVLSPGDAINREVTENLDFIATGRLPSKPADLLEHPRFGNLLQHLSAHYDFVLIDTPPVLGYSDALNVGRHAGAIFNIVRSDVSTVEEIEDAVKCLTQAGRNVTGTVFNDVKSRSARYRYAYGYGLRQSRHRYAA
jgi:tyrosine-protein kinase Etk/Wzc